MTKAKMPVIIRPLREADKAAWFGLWTAYLGFDGTMLPERVSFLTFDRLIGDDPFDHCCLVAETEGALVGFAHYLSHRHTWSTENVVYLQDLFVGHSARQNGCGRALIDAVYSAADAANTPRVYWISHDDNTPARGLYDQVAHLTNFVKYNRFAA